MTHGIEILRMKDPNEKHYKKKDNLFDLPMRILVVGKSQMSGKSNLIGNLLLQEDSRLYRDDFDGEDIYIFSASLKTDRKIKTLIEEKDIPSSNLFDSFDDDVCSALYDVVKDNYDDAVKDKRKPKHSLMIFDDLSFKGDLKRHKNGSIAKIFSNGRHINCSCILTAQKYTDILTSARENATGLCAFAGTDRQLELISEDHNYLEDKKNFKKMYRTITNQPHAFLVVNYSNPIDSRYMNQNFLPIGPCGKVRGHGCECE
jgi:hypothetical protein